MTKCIGCGALLQDKDVSLDGYVSNLGNRYCERCFRITHYNEYIYSNKEASEFVKKIDYINKTGDLVVLTIDFLNVIDFSQIKIDNPVIIAVTKRDIVPRSVIDNKFLSKIECDLNVRDILFVSSKNNYNLDLLYSLIKKYKTSNNVYFIGLTNAGKSSLINKMIKNYSDGDGDITISNLPSTTLDFLEKKIGDLVFIDTPGLLDSGNIIFKLDEGLIKKIIPKKEINPRIYQINCLQTIMVKDIFRLDIKDSNILIFYISNELKIERFFKEKKTSLKFYEINVRDNSDLVIKGLGFIKFKKRCHIKLYLIDGVDFFVRDSIV